MKPSHLVTLAIVLVITASWFATKAGSESTTTSHLITTRSDSQPEEPAPSSRSSYRIPSSEKLTESDWARVADDMRDLSKRLDKLKPSPDLEKRLKHYSKSELITALYEIRQSDLDLRDLDKIRRYLLGLIIKLDPADFCLDPYAAQLNPLTRPYWERYAIAEWVRLSPADAIAWLDDTAKKSHEPKQVTALEHNLFSSLVVADFEKAKARFLDTPENQRHRMMFNFDGFGSHWRGEDFQDHNIAGRFAELARLQGPKESERFIAGVIGGRGEEDRSAAVSRIQESLDDWNQGRGSWLPATTVADYLNKIDATPREQELCIEANVFQYKYYNREGDLDAFRKQFTAEVKEIRSTN